MEEELAFAPLSINEQPTAADAAEVTVEELLDSGTTRERTWTGVTPSDLKLAGDFRVRTLFKIPVKEGVTYCALLTIPLVPLCVMLISTYMNAQVIFLLANPDYFGVPDDKIGFVST